MLQILANLGSQYALQRANNISNLLTYINRYYYYAVIWKIRTKSRGFLNKNWALSEILLYVLTSKEKKWKNLRQDFLQKCVYDTLQYIEGVYDKECQHDKKSEFQILKHMKGKQWSLLFF